MSKPSISIIVPIYNASNFVGEAINSVLHQSFSNYELILVDDGSTDNSLQICYEYCNKDDRILVLHKENGGQLSARMYGLSHASGEYCVFLDADDELEKKALEIIEKSFQYYQSDCLIYGYKRVSTNNQLIREVKESQVVVLTDKKDIYLKCLTSGMYNELCRKAIRREVIPMIDYSEYFHLRRFEDLLQTIDIVKSCKSIVFLTESFYIYRFNENSVTNASNHYDAYKIDFSVYERLNEFLLRENIYSNYDWKKQISSNISHFLGVIKTISLMQIYYKDQRALLAELHNGKFYRECLSGDYLLKAVGKKNIVFILYKLKLYWLSCFLSKKIGGK